MLLYILGFLCLLLTGFVNATPFETCPGLPPPVEVIAHCGDILPCKLPQNTNANVNITFNIPHDVETGKIDIRALMGIEVPFIPPDNNLCHALTNGYCPLEKGERITYNMVLPILKYYPAIALKLKISFMDESKNVLSCFQMAAKVVKY
ncbi:Niemann-Pick type C-2c [Carabus blaptoides fortunei]